jgi:large subunit ribosomal protein L15
MPPTLSTQLPLRLIPRTPSIARALPNFCPKTQHRCESILGNLRDVRSSYHKKKRVGRGPSSGYGKTSGRGHKGQKQHGKVPAGFEGGQTPIEIVHGKRGFKNVYVFFGAPM